MAGAGTTGDWRLRDSNTRWRGHADFANADHKPWRCNPPTDGSDRTTADAPANARAKPVAPALTTRAKLQRVGSDLFRCRLHVDVEGLQKLRRHNVEADR